uniref:Uncharacterized protein n=1 Tax=Arion vulgaris TaxID=1028688 RepID=A0A0B7AIU0_9EUPU
MKTFNIKHTPFISDVSKTSQNFTLSSDVFQDDDWATNQIRTTSACDMTWKRISDTTLIAITGPECIGSLRTNQVRIGLSMILTKDQLQLTEGWYKLSHGTQLTELKISHILQKLPVADTLRFDRNKIRNSGLQQTGNDVYSADKPPRSDNSLKQPSWTENVVKPAVIFRNKEINKKKIPNIDRRISERIRRKTILRSFQEVLAALTYGYNVYFRIDLSMCLTPDQVNTARTVFGGKVKNFVITRQKNTSKRRRNSIYFLSQKNRIGNTGPELIIRNVTLKNDGYVEVKIHQIDHDSPWTSQGYHFECRLDSGYTGYGGVTMALSPVNKVKANYNMKALTKSDVEGRDINLFADLDQ